MNTTSKPNSVFILTEKWEDSRYWFNSILAHRKLTESLTLIPLEDFEDRIIFDPGSSRTKVRRLLREECHLFNLPEKFYKGAHIVFTKLSDQTVSRSLVFDTKYEKAYTEIVEGEFWTAMDEVKALLELAKKQAEALL